MSWYKKGIEKNIEKIDIWIEIEEERLKQLYVLKGKYDSYLKDYDSFIKRTKTKKERFQMGKLLKKLHEEFYSKYEKR